MYMEYAIRARPATWTSRTATRRASWYTSGRTRNWRNTDVRKASPYATPEKAELMDALPLAHAADFTGAVEGRSVNLPRFVNVEAGHQGSDAVAESAYDCLLAFLEHTGVLPGEPDSVPTTRYRVFETVEKEPGERYELLVENFERVGAGETYAKTAGGDARRADRTFWPVLMSADGHQRLLGYEAERTGEIRAVVGN